MDLLVFQLQSLQGWVEQQKPWVTSVVHGSVVWPKENWPNAAITNVPNDSTSRFMVVVFRIVAKVEHF
jgi:hypothetical protein